MVLATTFFQSSAWENGREGKSIEKWFGLPKEDLPCQPVKHSFIEIQLKCEFDCLIVTLLITSFTGKTVEVGSQVIHKVE